jgi:phosphohistidine phosphatase
VKRIYVLRHAKSSWDDPGPADHDRPLADRGRRAAKLLAEHLRGAGIVPELVLCSSARRTRETLEGIAPALGDEPRVLIEPQLYLASAGDLLVRLRAVPDAVDAVMVIGHNPGIQAFAECLAGRGEELDRVRRKYPTGALATLEFPGSWSELEPGAATLVEFVKPKDLG